jgi:hypothetical protein
VPYNLNESRQTPVLAEEPPPFLGEWKNVYTAVLLYLASLIIALYVITRSFAA